MCRREIYRTDWVGAQVAEMAKDGDLGKKADKKAEGG